MAYVIHALCIIQTVSLHKLAAAMPTYVNWLPSQRTTSSRATTGTATQTAVAAADNGNDAA